MIRRPALLLALAAAPLIASGHEETTVEEIVVEGRRMVLVGDARSASEGVVGRIDLELRALLRPGDLLEAIPGMIVTQHSGSGKSNQMFLRGFNLDHGTDFSTSIDGMPVNMRTHGHGQGYTDINFLIPETIDYLTFVKGPYHAELGDFSSAGGTQFHTFERVPKSLLKLSAGGNGYRRLLAMGGRELGRTSIAGAIEGQAYDGPWTQVEEDAQKTNGILKLARDTGAGRWDLAAMYYDNRWRSADQVPARAVSQGLIDELGSLDDTLGGESRRASLSGRYRSTDDDGRSFSISGYAIDYRLQLWSNFTYLLDDPVQGDQFEQLDDRTVWGGAARYQTPGGARGQFQHRLGADIRYDDIGQVGLYRTRARERLGTVREDSVDEASIGLFYELEWALSERWRTVLGLRGDHYRFDVDAGDPRNSGKASDSIVSPKASLVYTFSETAEAYLSAGRGFHSNDARGTTIVIDPVSGMAAERVDPLVASRGAEIGWKALWQDRWNSSVALWYLDLDSELLFVGDAGNTEASRPSRRWGLELNNHWAVTDTWAVEADVAWTDAAFHDDQSAGNEIPGAIPLVVSGTVTADSPAGWFGSFRVRHFSPYPLTEDGSQESDGSTIASLALGWRGETVSVQLDVLNLFDSGDHDIDYWYASRLPGEPLGGIEDRHFKVFEPRQLRAHVSYSFR